MVGDPDFGNLVGLWKAGQRVMGDSDRGMRNAEGR